MQSHISEFLRPGPVFIARFGQIQKKSQLSFDGRNTEKLKQILQTIYPLNTTIKHVSTDNKSIIGITDKDKTEHIRAYVIIHHNGNIELVGTIPTGKWGQYKDTWWPGAFEIPLLSQINDSINVLIDALAIRGEVSLQMELIKLENTAFIDHHGGSEYPHPFPVETNSFQYPTIINNFDQQKIWNKQEIVDCFNALRKSFHTSSEDPFYLKPYSSPTHN